MARSLHLEPRRGPRPETSDRLPHAQLTQHGPKAIVDRLHDWCFSLPGVSEEGSGISVPGARALILDPAVDGNHTAFMTGREFAHIHPSPDLGSMHVSLPAAVAREVVQQGWGEDHYLVRQGRYPAGLVLLFSPRDEAELETIQSIVRRSFEYATGIED